MNPIHQRDVLVSRRLLDNRLCADCDAPLGENTVYGSCTFGVWICDKCSEVHKSLSNNLSYVKSSQDEWLIEEVSVMRKAVSNVNVNHIYERFIPTGWAKCSADASQEDRELWIRAKYEFKMFVFPARKRGGDSFDKKIPPSSSVLPARLVDFFLVVGAGSYRSTNIDTRKCSPSDIFFEPVITTCYPQPDSYKDMILPEHVGPFVFPCGLRLSATEEPPFFYTFVLTDVSGVKMYGATLIVYELVDNDEIASMIGTPVNSPNFPSWPLVFAPKALTILSHYAFFNLFREFIEQLYRISLSSSPIPLERYIVNFVKEVPLPPQGKIEVNFSLADRSIYITRPRKNQLPMVDFSYRPLFTYLSLDNILLIFSSLCCERKICFFCENIAVLTPILEALLSLLFPLVWQGAYVPLMPDHMEDILDAPVPIIVGISRKYMSTAADMNGHHGVMYVDLDNDKVILGKDDYGRDMPPPPRLPYKAESKLKDKLEKFARLSHNQLFTKAGFAFPRNEHLTPILSFASEEGVTYQRTPVVMQKKSRKSNASATGYQHPVVCSKSTISCTTMLDPNNNTGCNDGFDAREIRGAFLRFFTSIFKNYHQLVNNDVTDSVSTKSSRTSVFSSGNDRALAKSIFKSSRQELISLITETQMFERFSEERSERPDLPEIKFFDESINDKLNRGSMGPYRRTPFLNDKSDEISETYTPPPPSNWGVPVGQTYSYLKGFPNLRAENYGTVRIPRPLLRSVEIQRTRRVLSDEVLQRFTSRRISAGGATGRKLSIEEVLVEAKKHYFRLTRMIIVTQNRAKTRKLQRQYQKIRKGIILLQRAWRGVRFRKLLKLYNANERALVCQIQKIVRGFLKRKRYIHVKKCIKLLNSFCRMSVSLFRFRRVKDALLLIQSTWRGVQVLRRYQNIRRCIVKLQSVMRKWLVWKIEKRSRSLAIEEYRTQIFDLWSLNCTPLIYRSRFWCLVKGTGYLDLALHQDELKRLYKSLGLKLNDKLAFSTQFANIQSALARKALGIHPPPESTVKAIEEERKVFYVTMKKELTEEIRLKFYRLFELPDSKKRKRHLVEQLWKKREQAGASSLIILDTLRDKDGNADWIKAIQRVRVEAAIMETVRASFSVICTSRRIKRSVSKYGEIRRRNTSDAASVPLRSENSLDSIDTQKARRKIQYRR